ncbi:MAG: SGNH/GDSL hydrolase family protein [bacterium]
MGLMQILGHIADHQSHDGDGYAYYIEGNMDTWRSTLAKLKSGTTGIFNVCCIGDSITEGDKAGNSHNDYRTKGFVGRLRTRLAATFGDVGLGFIPVHFSDDYPAFSFTGTWIDSSWYGIGNYQKRSSNTGATATVSFNGTGIGVVVARNNIAAQYTISIDGGAAVTHDTYNATLVSPYAYEETGLADTDHTAVITVDNGANPTRNLYFLGIYPIKGTTGIRVHDCARSGGRASDFVQTGCLDLEINYWTPVLTIVSLVANDFNFQTGLSAYETSMSQIIDTARTHGSCMVLANGLFNVSKTIPITAYEEVCRKLALSKGCAFLNLNRRWKSYSNANSLGYMADALVHPNQAGHQDIATFLLDHLLEER